MVTVSGDGGQSGCSTLPCGVIVIDANKCYIFPPLLYCKRIHSLCSGRDKRICGDALFLLSLVYEFPLLRLGCGTGGLRQMGHMEMVCRVCSYFFRY